MNAIDAPSSSLCSVPVDDVDAQWQKDYRRLHAIAKQQRRGNKQHAGVMAMKTAKGHLSQLVRRYQTRLESIERLQRMADSPLAKLTQELSPPEGYNTVAVFDCEEVSFYYENEDTGDMIELPWLFDQTYIWPDDCEAVGIRVE